MDQRQVSFGEAISRAFSNYCCFTGRASRSEYWWWVLLNVIIAIGLNILQAIFAGASAASAFDPDASYAATAGLLGGFGFIQIISLLWSLVTLLPNLGLIWRRLHDTGRSGWWYGIALLLCIPLVGFCIAATVAAFSGHSASGAFVGVGILSLAMIVYGIVILVFLCQASQPEENKYGEVPNVISFESEC